MPKNENKYLKESYSQCGEDLIIKFIFEALQIQKPGYLDIGAHHPLYLNNTAIFYNNKSTGINIEPDPLLFEEFQHQRKKDTNLNIGVSNITGVLDFYQMSVPSLNTFSKDEASYFQSNFNVIVKNIIKVKVDTLLNVVKTFCKGVYPDILFIDCEGLELPILKTIQFESENVPKVICVETLSYSETRQGKKDTDIIEFLKSKNYLLYADTHINSIFVLEKLWRK